VDDHKVQDEAEMGSVIRSFAARGSVETPN
jgi:hypothetical protein